ncbi:MAG: HEAT repeat domain-containing protein [Candidatus Brocadiae bacterium]|nr:HEAT repeat domain-containing protein [Candidatus Brocadiia bacterium]
MALINCAKCDEKISDKAKTCPKCGSTTPFKKLRNCPECLVEIPIDIEFCPECGYPNPFEKNNEHQKEEDSLPLDKQEDSCGYPNPFERNNDKQEDSCGYPNPFERNNEHQKEEDSLPLDKQEDSFSEEKKNTSNSNSKDKEQIKKWVSYLSHNDTNYQCYAKKLIIKSGKNSVEFLIPLLQDEDWSLRFTAVKILYEIGSDAKEAVQALQNALAKEKDIDVSKNIIRTLNHIESEKKSSIKPEKTESVKPEKPESGCTLLCMGALIGPIIVLFGIVGFIASTNKNAKERAIKRIIFGGIGWALFAVAYFISFLHK